MRRLILSALVLAAATAFGQQLETVFTSGAVDRKDKAGALRALDIGDRLGNGEMVITGKNGKAELSIVGASAVIHVKPASVLLVGEKTVGTERRTVLQTVAGSVSMKFNSLVGKEPLVGTAAVVAAIRGTELEVYAGSDGSSLVAVISGAVSLEAAGTTVELGANEAVETKAGEAPGEKFAWLGKEIDFSDWNSSRLESFLADPVAGLRDVEAQLGRQKSAMLELLSKLAEVSATYDEVYAELKRRVDAKDEKGAEELRQTRFFPIMQAKGVLILDVRFYALSALSLRRFALGSMYAQMKARHLLEADSGTYADFLDIYRGILADFEETFVPQLIAADI